MFAAIDLFLVLVAGCLLATIALLVCLVAAGLEALRAERPGRADPADLAHLPAAEHDDDDVEGFRILGPVAAATARAEPAPTERTPVAAEAQVADEVDAEVGDAAEDADVEDGRFRMAPYALAALQEPPAAATTVRIDAPTVAEVLAAAQPVTTSASAVTAAAAAVIDLDEQRLQRTGEVPAVVAPERRASAAPRGRRRSRRADRVGDAAGRPRRLPAGAEAALRSIAEVRPDPRNTVALQRDPTGEVTLTSPEVAAAVSAARARRLAVADAGERTPPAGDRRSA